MIELSLNEMRNPNFVQAMQKISACSKLSFPISYHLARIISKIEQENKLANDVWDKLVKKHAKPDDKSPGQMIVPEENREAFAKDAKEFGEAKITIDKHKVKVSDLSEVGLTPSELCALEPIVFDMEVIEGEKSDGKKESIKEDDNKKSV